MIGQRLAAEIEVRSGEQPVFSLRNDHRFAPHPSWSWRSPRRPTGDPRRLGMATPRPPTHHRRSHIHRGSCHRKGVTRTNGWSTGDGAQPARVVATFSRPAGRLTDRRPYTPRDDRRLARRAAGRLLDRGHARRRGADDHGRGAARDHQRHRRLDRAAPRKLDHQRLPAGLHRGDAARRPGGRPLRPAAAAHRRPRHLRRRLAPGRCRPEPRLAHRCACAPGLRWRHGRAPGDGRGRLPVRGPRAVPRARGGRRGDVPGHGAGAVRGRLHPDRLRARSDLRRGRAGDVDRRCRPGPRLALGLLPRRTAGDRRGRHRLGRDAVMASGPRARPARRGRAPSCSRPPWRPGCWR